MVAAPPLMAPPLAGWLWLPAAPPELEVTPEDPAAPLVAGPPVVSPSFAEAQPTADSATTNPRDKSSVIDLPFMIRLSATRRFAEPATFGGRCSAVAITFLFSCWRQGAAASATKRQRQRWCPGEQSWTPPAEPPALTC
jgi:hypothetical protein